MEKERRVEIGDAGWSSGLGEDGGAGSEYGESWLWQGMGTISALGQKGRGKWVKVQRKGKVTKLALITLDIV